MTFSEFGRRIASNDSLGTDHGAAAPMFLFGTQVNGGGIFGSNPVLPAQPTDSDNVPIQVDFREVYATILKNWFCVSKPVMDSILLQDFDCFQC